MLSSKSINSSSTARLAIAALLATFLVATPWAQSPAQAADPTPNNATCDLATVSANVFSITTALELWEVTDCVSTDGGNNTFRLDNDIAVPSQAPFDEPIGASTSPVAFTGTLDGNDKSITGISISQGVGLFVALNNAEIKEVLVAGSISGSVNSAGLSASASGAITLSNVISEVRVSLSATVAAGFLAYVHQNSVVSISGSENRGEVRSANGIAGGFLGSTGQFVTISIEDSTNSGPVVSDNAPAGGFIGQLGENSVGYLINVSNTHDVVSSKGVGVGGLVGLSEAGTQLIITSVENAGEIVVTQDDLDFYSLGGLVGWAKGTVEMSDSVNSGVVDGGTGQRVGGLIGQADAGVSISNTSNTNKVSGSFRVGGFIGASFGEAHVSDSTNSGLIVGSGTLIGGIFGVANAGATISHTSNTNAVSGSGTVGGLIGRGFGSTRVSDSTNTGAVTAIGEYAGGLVGQAQSVFVTNSSNEALVSGDEVVGGLVGLLSHASLESTISNSLNSGPVNGRSKAGGLVGDLNANVEFVRSHNSGNITGAEYQGGLVGWVSSGGSLNTSEVLNTGNISASSGDAGGLVGVSIGALKLSNSFNSGSVNASRFAAGFAVQFVGSSAATNSYQVGTVTSGDEGHPVFYKDGGSDPVFESVYTNQNSDSGFPTSTDAQLQQKATYVGWDFDTVWGFVCGTNNNFPVLRFANPTATADDCGPLGGDTGSGGTPAPTPTYTGPTLVSQVQPVASGSSVTFTGSKLDVVTKAMIGTTEVPISSQTATSLTITVPATLAAATYDLVLFSSFGTLSVMGAITIAGVQAESVSQAQLFGWSWTLRFIGNSRSLSTAQETHLRARVLAQPNATTVICWGYTTASSPNAWAIAHATQRAQAACNLVASANSEVKTVVRLRYGVEKSWAMRSAVQFWG